MQLLTAAPRAHLTKEQVTSLLVDTPVFISSGLEILDSNLAFVEDITDSLIGGEIERLNYRTPHSAIRLSVARELVWGKDLVRPYMILSNGQIDARWNLGVFSLTTPERKTGRSPVVYEVSGQDRVYLLGREVGDTWEAPSGAGVLAEVRRALAAAGLTGLLLDSAKESATLPRAMVWPLIPTGTDGKADQTGQTTWLHVINDLLATINYRGIWADELGFFRSEPYRHASEVAPEFNFSTTGDQTIIDAVRTLHQDIWKAPNRWVFVQQNRPTDAPEPTVGDGLYIVANQSDGPTSIDARGLVWNRQISVDVADQASLVAVGDRKVAADRRSTTMIDARIAPFPGAGHFDVFQLEDDELGTFKVQASQWTLSLNGADSTYKWEKV